ncbi:unnamed protein product [Brassica rapa]|uniref:Uncharacterized protein n=2 Tax=Brassica TaxID=3705 RepID=A0A3P6BPH5_BRACM|nr:unnamed protein product [Brassica napus]CAG7901994.1 unnamed protein product [Brassica rapa]CDY46633.1 BnaA07g10630D [Brassica napus]VDC97808.1 unnamed protein product [Brassica rapa]
MYHIFIYTLVNDDLVPGKLLHVCNYVLCNSSSWKQQILHTHIVTDSLKILQI